MLWCLQYIHNYYYAAQNIPSCSIILKRPLCSISTPLSSATLLFRHRTGQSAAFSRESRPCGSALVLLELSEVSCGGSLLPRWRQWWTWQTLPRLSDGVLQPGSSLLFTRHMKPRMRIRQRAKNMPITCMPALCSMRWKANNEVDGILILLIFAPRQSTSSPLKGPQQTVFPAGTLVSWSYIDA